MARASGYRQPGNWASLRKHILRRDHHACYVCAGHATTVDHVVPISAGGTHHVGNLAAICEGCHDAKTERERLAAIERRQSAKRRPIGRHPGSL